jgi:transcriptional regulator with XRE-family HTH domain
MVTFGERVKDLRNKYQWTQDELADRLEVTKQAVSGWERNVTSPSNKQLIQLADLFHVSTDYMLGRTNFFEINSRPTNDNLIELPVRREHVPQDLERLLQSHEIIRLGAYKLSSGDKSMAIDVLRRIFEEFTKKHK